MGDLDRAGFWSAPCAVNLGAAEDRGEKVHRGSERGVDCDLLYTLERTDLSQRRGEVTSLERKRDISRKIVQGLALAGL